MTSYRIAAVAAVSSANAALSALAYASPLVSEPRRADRQGGRCAPRVAKVATADIDTRSQERR
jgi:hypothetical protein